jgi:hypothetical protein
VSEWSSALESVCEHWATAVAGNKLRSSSAARYGQVFGAFCRFAEASGVVTPESVTTALCRRFIAAPSLGGSPPCAATSRLRLTALASHSASGIRGRPGQVCIDLSRALRSLSRLGV